jgi:hypothetical protein
MEDYLLALRQPLEDLHFSLIPMPDPYGFSVSAASFAYKHTPGFTFTKGGTSWDLKNILPLPGYDPRLDPVTVSKPIGRIDKVCDDVYALFLNT